MRFVSVVIRTLIGGDRLVAFRHNVVDLGFCRPNDAVGVREAGRPHDLFGEDPAGLRQLPRPRRCRDEHRLWAHRLPLFELERSVVDTGRQPETKLR